MRARLADVAVLSGGERLCLADLDEALFALDGVLDFRAALGTTAGGERLTIELLVEAAAARRIAPRRRRPRGGAGRS